MSIHRLPKRLTDTQLPAVPSNTRPLRTQPYRPLLDLFVRELDHRYSMEKNARDLTLASRFRRRNGRRR